MSSVFSALPFWVIPFPHPVFRYLDRKAVQHLGGSCNPLLKSRCLNVEELHDVGSSGVEYWQRLRQVRVNSDVAG